MVRAALATLLALAPPCAMAGPQLTGSSQNESCHVWSGARSVTSASGYVGAAAWILVFDDTAAPADGTLTTKDAGGDLVQWVDMLSAGSWSIWFGDGPNAMGVSNGLVICASSTGPFTKTAYSTANFRAQVQ